MLLDEWKEKGKEIAVLGLGRSGIAAARLLLSRGVKVYASESDSGPELEKRTAPLGRSGASVQLGGHDLMRIKRAAAVIVSPGSAENCSVRLLRLAVACCPRARALCASAANWDH